jgi:hypothetical protein
MIKPLVALTLSCIPLIVNADCRELDVVRSLSKTDYGYTKVESPVKAGRYAQRFELRSGDCAAQPEWSDCNTDRERSEVKARNHIPLNSYKIVKFNVFLPTDFQSSDKVNTSFGQIHQVGGPSGFSASGLPSRPPLLQFSLKRNDFRMCWHANPTAKDSCKWFDISTLDDLKGKWNEVIIEMNTSPSSGYAKVFFNKELKVDIQEPLYSWNTKEFYFKYGIYNSFVSRHGGPMPTQVAYFDEVQMVDSFDKLCTKAID